MKKIFCQTKRKNILFIRKKKQEFSLPKNIYQTFNIFVRFIFYFEFYKYYAFIQSYRFEGCLGSTVKNSKIFWFNTINPNQMKIFTIL